MDSNSGPYLWLFLNSRVKLHFEIFYEMYGEGKHGEETYTQTSEAILLCVWSSQTALETSTLDLLLWEAACAQ